MRRWAWTMVAVLALAGCESWLGESSKPPLPGKRISVLSKERLIEPETKGKPATILLPPPEPNDDWPQAGGYANHAMHHMVVADQIRRAWKTDIGSGSSKRSKLLAQPIIAEGMVFTLDADTEITAVDARTGKKLWTSDITPPGEGDTFSGGGLAYEDGRLFVSTGFAQVVAVDIRTGKALWRQTLSGPMRGAPTVRGGRVFVITVDNQAHALAAEDGKALWSHTGTPEQASILAGTSPAVDGNVVVIPYSSGELFALRVENGAVLWQEALSSIKRTEGISALTDIRGRPVIDRGRVYAIGHSDMLVAIELRSGRRLWEREIGGTQSPWVAGDYVFVISNENEATALEAKTGKILWVTELQTWHKPKKREGRVTWVGPVLASDRLIFGNSDGVLLALSPYDGSVLGTEDLSDGVSIQPSIAGGTIYFLTDDADLVAYR
ncbi:MAG: PQQ-binding-like beta-propeller repeat protein [Magnetospirillum sp.]|nr:PQQ-binding-like beta-propeller repeat protein [Magnetospirillum sp.]